MRPGERLILPLWFRTGVVVAIVMTLFLSFRQVALDNSDQTQTPAIEHRTALVTQKLRFVDSDNGTISVIDADDDREIARLEKGEDGFMRSVMRGLVRERKAQGLGPEVPFELTVWEDGLVSLIDPATARRVELSAFGRDNVKAFTRLLPGFETPRNPPAYSTS